MMTQLSSHTRSLAIRMAALGLSVSFSFAGPATAEEIDTFLTDYSAVVSKVATVRTVTELCAERDPAGAVRRAGLLAAWEAENELHIFDTITRGVGERYSELKPQLDGLNAQARSHIGPQIQEKPGVCTEPEEYSELLDSEDMQLRAPIRALLLPASSLGVDLESEAAPPRTSPPLTVTRLSVDILSLMDEVGTQDEAREDRDIRDKRETYATAWLSANGRLSLFGRVTSEDTLRDWRGEQQSRFDVECRSFRDDEHEARFAASRGRNAVITGQFWTLWEREGQGTVKLENCEHSPLRLIGTVMARKGDEAGLMPRPVDETEAYAGPREGPPMRSIDQVIYNADFSMRLDGFGNGYTDRTEDIYVLLKNGQAFRHDWSFPVTDVNIDLLKKREPARWYRWRKSGKNILLRPSDGGEQIVIETPARLRPVGNNTRLDKEYYYLNVGMMGVRTDRSYIFRKDGTVDYHRGGFVAGTFGTHYITVVGNNDDVIKGRKYRFEDYALIIDSDDGEERHFFAIREDTKRQSPDEVFINGEVYWEKDKKN